MAEQQGNLQANLIVVNAVEDAVKFGIIEGSIELFDNGIFGFESGFAGDEGVFAIIGGEVGRKLIGTVGEDGRKGNADSAEAGRFERRIIISHGFAEVGSAHVELFGEFAGFMIKITDHGTKSHNDKEEHYADNGNFGNQPVSNAAFLSGFDWAIGLRDLVEISEVIHKDIIA